MDFELQSEYLRTGAPDLLQRLEDQQWAARAALEALYTQQRDLVDVEVLLQIGLRATQEPSSDAQQRLLRRTLVDLQRRTDVYKQSGRASQSEQQEAPSPAASSSLDHSGDAADESGWDLDEEEEEVDDANGPTAEGSANHNAAAAATHVQPSHLPFSLFDFLTSELLDVANRLAETQHTEALQILFNNLAFPPRHILSVCDALPLSVDSITLVQLLSQSLSSTARDREKDWSDEPRSSESPPPTLDEVSHWCLNRARRLDAELGLLDQAFLLLQHAASKGVPGLDGLGEELSLLCKLVYDRPDLRLSSASDNDDWSLERWQHTDPADLFAAYLEHSTRQTIDSDVRRLALPYAFVLEAKAERAGRPEPDLHSQMLRQWMFRSVSSANRLPLVTTLIQRSKPDMDQAKRLIKDDLELARVALSVVYGNPSTSHWPEVSAIVDCLPALSSAAPEGSTATTPLLVASAAPRPEELYQRLLQFSSSDLSRAMDALDVHVEQAEILERWHAPVRLSWFSQHAHDAAAQKSLALKLVNSACRAFQRGEDWLENQDDWEALMEDLVRLARPGKEVDPDLWPALGQLDQQEVLDLFFKGLLRSGAISTAKSLLNPSTGSRPLEPSYQEKLCLDTSRELYDNAETCNLHGGDLKLAYDCLSMAPQTPAVRQEREFIEATSKLASYNLRRDGSPISPIQIRLTKDKLSLISELLQSSEDAHRHPDLLLDLSAKLGHRGDKVAEVKVMAMVLESHIRQGEKRAAVEVAQRIIQTTESLRATKSNPDAFAEASQVAWQACQRAIDAASHDMAPQIKMDVLAQTLLLCPPSAISQLMVSWRAAEEERNRQPAKPTLSRLNTSASSPLSPSSPSPLNSAIQLGQAAASSYLGRPDSPATLSPASALDSLMHGREGGVRDRLQTGMTSGLRWLVEG